MNAVTWDILRVFPDLGALESRHAAPDIQDALESLEKNGFLLSAPLDSAPAPSSGDVTPITAMGLVLRETGGDAVMSGSVIAHALELLFQECRNAGNPRLFLDAGNPDEMFGIIDEILSLGFRLAKKNGKSLSVSLSISQLPSNPKFLRRFRRYNLALELKCPSMLMAPTDPGAFRRIARQLAPYAFRTIVSITPAIYNDVSLPQILARLEQMGLGLVYPDLCCSGCSLRDHREGARGEKLRTLPEGWAFSFSNLPESAPGLLMTAIPMIRTVAASGKKKHGCRAGLDYIAVSPDGALFPCHHAIHDRRQMLGRVETGADPHIRRERLRRGAAHKQGCSGCGIRYLCGGGPFPDDPPHSGEFCRAMKEWAEWGMATFQELNLKQKMAALGIDDTFNVIMPHLGAPAEKPSKHGTERTLIVTGGSMRPLLKEGDRVLLRPCDPAEVRMGDIICFGKPITCHRAIRIYRRRRCVLEKGDAQLSGSVIPMEAILGKVIQVEKKAAATRLDHGWRRPVHLFIAICSWWVHIVRGAAVLPGRRKKRITWRNYQI